MKLTKLYLLVLLALLISFLGIACDDSNGQQTCDCVDWNPTYTDEVCSCGLPDCNCQPGTTVRCAHDASAEFHIDDANCTDPNCKILPGNIFYGYLTTAPIGIDGKEIKIFGSTGVTKAQIDTAVERIQDAYNLMDPGQKGNFESKAPTRIVIIAEDGPTYTWDGQVLGIRSNRNQGQIGSLFFQIGSESGLAFNPPMG